MYLVAFDTETTGLDTAKDRVLTAFIGERDFRFNPGVSISPEASAVNGLSDEIVATYPDASEVWPQVVEYLHSLPADAVLVGHYVRFDVELLRAEASRFGLVLPALKTLCTRELDKLLVPERDGRRNLDALHREYVGAGFVGAHEAKADALATLALAKVMLSRFDGEVPLGSLLTV